MIAFSWMTARIGFALTALMLSVTPVHAAGNPQDVLAIWYRLTLELVRHTPTYSPPVASRALAYIGITGYEAVASGSADMQSLAGQLTGLPPLPRRDPGANYDETVVLQAALSTVVSALFANTGPTGHRALAAMSQKQAAKAADGVAQDVAARSETFGQSIAAHILDWAQDDGGAVIENMGFPFDYALTEGPAHWVPTSSLRQQQLPLLPNWGKNRPFAMPAANACPLPPPPTYSEDPTSAFFAEAKEVVDTKAALTPEQRAIARFWSDDAMLTTTPPGHWTAIALQIQAQDPATIEQSVDVLARLGIATADAFIGAWQTKYQYDLLRPVSYIRRTMDPKWESTLTTPPFPEYPSGHSVQSAAAAAVMTSIYGDRFAFDDAAHADDGLPARHFASFWAAAEEAAISRLYGGIHFRSAIERGMDQGSCIGAFAAALKTRSK
jgi:membrane-associated phospholipid phosphatase